MSTLLRKRSDVGGSDEPGPDGLTYVQWRKQCQARFLDHGMTWTATMQCKYFTVGDAMVAHRAGTKAKDFADKIYKIAISPPLTVKPHFR